MFKKKIKYTNFNGEKREQDLYFNLTEQECTELEVSESNSLSNKIEIIANSEDRKEIVRIFKEIILKAYGERSADGEVFMKSDEIRHKFECSAAFNALFMELVQNESTISEFINAVVPKPKNENVSGIAPFQNVAK